MNKTVDRDWLHTNFPCMMACPGPHQRGTLRCPHLEGRFEETYRFARDPNPMASICGCVCAHGSQIVEVSGSKQTTEVGGQLPQPVVVQVNGADGNAVEGALVAFRGEGLAFSPQQALCDSGGQATTSVQVGFVSGDYQVIADTPKQSGGSATLSLHALGYEATF